MRAQFYCFYVVLSFLVFSTIACSEPSSSSHSGTDTKVSDVSLVESGAPFNLTNDSGDAVLFTIPKDGLVVLEWFNQGCPFVQKLYKNGFMQKLQSSYRAQGVQWFLINSTNPSHGDFLSPEKRAKLISEWTLDKDSFLFDEAGVLGAHLGAKTTPHIFIFKDGELIYNGAADDAPDTDSDPALAKNFIKETLDHAAQESSVSLVKNRPYGCSIKYAK